MILIAYDGSDDAKAAIQHAGKLMPGFEATVLTIWEPFTTLLDRTPETLRPLAQVRDADEIDRQSSAQADESAQEGVALAKGAGLEGTPLTTPLVGSTADTIIAQADKLNADAIVVGSRGLTGVALLVGSVSLAVIQKADRPVVIVPAADAQT
jgi:nucleotide-binding universal stress UspA family protein